MSHKAANNYKYEAISLVRIHQFILQKDSSDIMAHSAGSSFLSSLSAELPDKIKLQQQIVHLEEEKKRLIRIADKEEQQLLKISAQYKSTRFRIKQVDEQLRKAKTELKGFDPKAPKDTVTSLADVHPRSPEESMDE